MFDLDYCSYPGCKNKVRTGFRLCEDHQNWKSAEHFSALMSENELIRNIKAPGLIFKNLDLRNKRFIDCYFHHTQWINCRFDESLFQMCFFDESVFIDTSFTKVDMKHCVFTDSVMTNIDWHGSDLISVNLNKIHAVNNNFSESDLYYSRFIAAYLKDVKMVDCNLKRVDFSASQRKNINFKYSNTEEAYFDTKELP